MGFFQRQLAIDLGTGNTRIYVRGGGIVLNEPSVIARERDSDTVVAVGAAAEELMGREPEKIEVSRPLVSGVIADFAGAKVMLETFIRRASGRWHLSQPEAMITVPSGATSTEQRAVIDVGRRAGLRNTYLIPSGVSAALGAGLPIIEPKGHMIIDIGSETTEVAVLSLGGVVASRSIRLGGASITEAIMRSIKRTQGVQIGAGSAEEAKRLVGTLKPKSKAKMKVHGRANVKGKPQTLEITAADLKPTLENNLERIILAARSVLEKTPPDLVSDIVENGLNLSGGGSQLDGLEDYLGDKLQTDAKLAQDPELCAVKGAFIAITHLNDYKRSLLGI